MENQERQDWKIENSLTTPSDRDRSANWRPDQSSPPLSNDEVGSAMIGLNNKVLFPTVERLYADNPVRGQDIGLFSFTPAKGASPNGDGFYGFAKLRGNFSNSIEADEQAERVIRSSGTCHQIFHVPVGRPFPLTVESLYSETVDTVDVEKEVSKAVSAERREMRQKQKQEEDSIKMREEALLADTQKDELDPFDNYITVCTKKAQLVWTYLEHQKKMKEVKELIIKARIDINEMDEEHKEFKDMYFEKFMDARRKAGIKDTDESSQENFIKFMVEDVELDFDKDE